MESKGIAMNNRSFLVLLGFVLACGRISAATLLLNNGVIHTVSGPTLTNGSVLSRDGIIVDVGENLSQAADQVINLAGGHVYPGLIAATTIAGLVEIEAVRATRDFAEVGEYTPDVRSWMAVNPDSDLLPVARANGVTHIVPVPTGGIVSGHSGVVALDGWTAEEMAVKKPAALNLFWPSMELDTTPKEQFKDKNKWKSLEEQEKERSRKLKAFDDFFQDAEAYAKTMPSGATNRGGKVPAWEAMLPLVRREIPLIVHADDIRQIKAAVLWAQMRKYKIVIAGGMDAWMEPHLLATNNVPVIYERVYNQATGMGATPTRDYLPYDVHFSAPEILRQAGVKVAISGGLGGDAAEDLRNLPYLAAQAAAFGLPATEAIKAITLYPAEIYGISDQLGSLQAGKEATFFIADGDILDIRNHVLRVWIAGKEVSLQTRHTRLYEKYRARPKSR